MRSPSANPPRTQPAVLVVGAGPTGLLLAGELQRRNVPCHLIDAKPAPLHWDRATVVHSRSLEIFESLGFADKFLEAGCRQRVIKVYSDGKLLGMLDLSTCPSRYGFNVGLSEEVTERILTEYLEQHGGEVHRSSKLVGLAPHGDGMCADIERDGQCTQVEARWVIGCDGIHSVTREISGIALQGHDIERAWAVFDAGVKGWNDTFEANIGFLDLNPVLLTAIPEQRFRIYMRPTTSESDLVAEATAVLKRYVPAASFVNVENPTRFHCHTRVAARYRAGAIFLAGDAAHLCSPAEGHGMNCGLQDAFNLAWKLALVHHGDADEALLDSYEAERRPAAQIVTESGDRVEEAQTLTNGASRAERDRNIAAAMGTSASRYHEVVAETELNVDYAKSPIVAGETGGALGAGRPIPSTIPLQDSKRRVHELAHRAGHTLMLVGGPSADPSTLVDMHTTLEREASNSRVFGAAVALGTHDELPAHMSRIDRDAADALGVDDITLLIVRPDGYIGMRCDRDHVDGLERYRATVRAGRLPFP